LFTTITLSLWDKHTKGHGKTHRKALDYLEEESVGVFFRKEAFEGKEYIVQVVLKEVFDGRFKRCKL
jgi:hypothetical protein